MKYDDLPPRWKDRLSQHLAEIRPDGWQHISASDFTDNLRVDLPDGSFVQFLYAFALELEDEVAIFTEHCGYHIFSTHDLVIKTFSPVFRF